MSGPDSGQSLADAPADVAVSPPELLAKSFRRFEHYSVTMRGAGGQPLVVARDILQVGPVVAVLPIDLARDEVVLIRQFRLTAHLALGTGDLVEIVAGHVEPGEDPAFAARRECHEEIGVTPASLHELFTFMPAPGQVCEWTTFYLAFIDASAVPESAGAAIEAEHTRPLRLRIDDAVAALSRPLHVHNGYLILALHWLALNRGRLAEFARGGIAPAR